MMFELAPFALPSGYGEAILSLDDAKRHLSIDLNETEFDDEVAAYRDAAVDMVEQYCGVALGERDVTWRGEGIPARFRLPVRPVVQLVSGEYLDTGGATQQIDVSTLRLGLRGEVLLKSGQSWPSGIDGGIELTFTAGYASGECPAALVQAVRMFTAHLFANREAVITGTISGEIPLGFRTLCSPYRAVVV